MPFSIFCGPTEKILVIPPPSFITKTREIKPHLQLFMTAFSFPDNILHFDSKCCESHFSRSLNRLLKAHPLAIDINNQMNIIFSMLQSIVYIVHSLSTDLKRKGDGNLSKNLPNCPVFLEF